MNIHRQKTLYLAIVFLLANGAIAAENLPIMSVQDTSLNTLGETNTLTGNALAQNRARTNDTASLLDDIAGVNTIKTGGRFWTTCYSWLSG